MFAAVFRIDYLSLVFTIFLANQWKTGIHLLRGDSISLKLFYNSLANYISARRVSNSLFLMWNICSLAFTISVIFRFTKLNQSKHEMAAWLNYSSLNVLPCSSVRLFESGKKPSVLIGNRWTFLLLTKPSDLYVVKTMMHVNRQINKLYNLNDLKKKK